jgi:G3E family GTPase
MIMLTGFLGAGKTTLLRALLAELANRKHLVDVILNDRENAEIDRETLDDRSADIEALSGSCICCDGYSDLIELVEAASQKENDALLIEVNGTADPIPLMESFTLQESKFRLRPRWQVCVIDARNFGKRGYFSELEKLQLETASHYYISWSSDLSSEEVESLRKRVEAMNPHASQTSVSALVEALSRVIQESPRQAIADSKVGKSNNSLAFTSTTSSPQLDDRHTISHAFTGCQVIIPEAVDSSDVIGWLEALPASVIRAKALVKLNSNPDLRYLYQRVGRDISPDPISGRTKSTSPCSSLFIGAELDPAEILELSRKHLHPNCHFPPA